MFRQLLSVVSSVVLAAFAPNFAHAALQGSGFANSGTAGGTCTYAILGEDSAGRFIGSGSCASSGTSSSQSTSGASSILSDATGLYTKASSQTGGNFAGNGSTGGISLRDVLHFGTASPVSGIAVFTLTFEGSVSNSRQGGQANLFIGPSATNIATTCNVINSGQCTVSRQFDFTAGLQVEYNLSAFADGSAITFAPSSASFEAHAFISGVAFTDSAGNPLSVTYTSDTGLQYGARVNLPPTANAGKDQAIHEGSTVQLDGTASSDDNTPTTSLGYAWTLPTRPTGSAASLVNANTATPTFVADKAGGYSAQLVVTDGDGLKSLPATVNISSINLPPTARAGADQLVIVFQTVQLNGSTSSDPDADPLTYAWSITARPAGSVAVLNGPATATPNFQPDVAGTYSITLNVSDPFSLGTPDTVEVVAITAAAFAQQQLLSANAVLTALAPSQVTTAGNQTAFGKLLSEAVKALQKGNTATAIEKINDAITRTDGCSRTGAPDVNVRGRERDWITDCSAQATLLTYLRSALAALTP